MGKSHNDLAVAIWRNSSTIGHVPQEFSPVAIWRNSSTIGHVPREFSQVCWYYLQKNANEITFIVSGDRKRRETVWLDHVSMSSGANEMLITPFTKLTASNWFYKRFTDYSMQ